MIDWDQVLINTAISNLQGILESGKLGLIAEINPELAADDAIRLAIPLVEKLKEHINSKNK